MWKSVHSISASIKINVGGGGDNMAPDNNNTPDHVGAGGASFGSYSTGAAAAGASAFTWEKLSPEEFQQLQDLLL